MELEKNPKTRRLAIKLLQLEDKISGKPFSGMARVKEISNYACGPATLVMMLSFVGVKTSQTGIIRSIRATQKIKKYGITISDFAKAVKIKGRKKISFWRKQRASINDLQLAIEKYKFPAGVEWQGEFYENTDEDNGHYCVVTKVDKKVGTLRMADPYFNSYFHYNNIDRKFDIPEFMKKWWDTNEIKVTGTSKMRTVKDIRVMFVITPKGESWPKRLGMTRA